MKAKKSFGQHFLINESLAKGIVDAALVKYPHLPILEVGPGKGVLTKYLLESQREFKAVDADRDMIAYLEQTYPDNASQFILQDFLKTDLTTLFDNKPFIILGNFPYNISSQIVFKAIDMAEEIPLIIGMFQKEMADRIIAPHGSKTYGVISVLTQCFYKGRTVFKVSPGSFSPPPKVNSSVIELEYNPQLPPELNYSLLKQVVKNSFNQRRKMLRNTLKSLVNDELLADSMFTLRPEQLSVQQFIDLALLIQNQKK